MYLDGPLASLAYNIANPRYTCVQLAILDQGVTPIYTFKLPKDINKNM